MWIPSAGIECHRLPLRGRPLMILGAGGKVENEFIFFSGKAFLKLFFLHGEGLLKFFFFLGKASWNYFSPGKTLWNLFFPGEGPPNCFSLFSSGPAPRSLMVVPLGLFLKQLSHDFEDGRDVQNSSWSYLGVIRFQLCIEKLYFFNMDTFQVSEGLSL